MPTVKDLLPWLKWLGIALVLWWIHHLGVNQGKEVVQARWDQEKAQTQQAIQKVKNDTLQAEADHRVAMAKVTLELDRAKQNHLAELAAVESRYAARLRSSEARAGIYQRQAQAGPAQCRDLASHAARLDASLEEGRSLVWELRTTLGLRDQQIRLLGTQLLNDRQLLSDDGN